MKQLGAWLAIGVAACGSGAGSGRRGAEVTPALAKGGVAVLAPGVVPCQERALDGVDAESAAVDATASMIYWLDYDFGTLMRIPRDGGEAVTLLEHDEEHLAESMRVAGGWIWWTSKQGGVWRLAERGGEPELVIATDRMPDELEVVGDVVYAATMDGAILWWRSPTEHGEIQVAGGDLALATDGSVLWVGSDERIDRIGAPGAGLQRELDTDAPVARIAARPGALYWVEGRSVKRRIAGTVEAIGGVQGYASMAAAADGVFVADDGEIWFAPDAPTAPALVASLPDAVVDLELRGASLFVGTDRGGAVEICP